MAANSTYERFMEMGLDEKLSHARLRLSLLIATAPSVQSIEFHVRVEALRVRAFGAPVSQEEVDELRLEIESLIDAMSLGIVF